jgi:DNA-binding transcriptional LysR family regulator
MLNQIDLSRTDLNLLALFEIVLEQRHVGRAAARLDLSPSAVSHGLSRLRRLLNDPLFVRTPKGVVPTARALELAAPIADILARARSVIATAAPFDPATSSRRFIVSAPDSVSAVILLPLLADLARVAPGIDIVIRQLLPSQTTTQPDRAWHSVFADLEARTTDIAIAPLAEVPARFASPLLYEEDFVIATRAKHPFAEDPTLDRFCRMRHLVVSQTGDTHGFVDDAVAKTGRARRVALTVPNAMMALAVVAESDLAAALPRRFAAMHGARFGVVSREAPLALPRFAIRAIAPKAAMMDTGLAWLFQAVEHAIRPSPPRRPPRGAARRRRPVP